MKIPSISVFGLCEKPKFDYRNQNKYLNVAEQPQETKVTADSALAFYGLNAKGIVKHRGLLMHITNLPAHRSFCGQFGDPQTIKFIQWLKAAKQTHWILNPMNELDDTLCPYGGIGRFSRNKFVVNLNKLTSEEYGKLLKTNELPDDITAPNFTFDMLQKQKEPRIERAFKRFVNLPETAPIKVQYSQFVKDNELWLEDYANYNALSVEFGGNWWNWDKTLQRAPEASKKENISLENKILQILRDNNKTIENYSKKVDKYKFEQFLYDKQYNEMVDYLNENNIHLIMDLPIGVSATGADTWGKKGIFLLDENFKPTKVSGCPSESAYSYTQVWGHALYNYDSPEFWEYQEQSLKQLLKTADLRLDHFVGYINRAAIPTKYANAEGVILNEHEIFKPVEEGGLGPSYFDKTWIEDIYSKKNSKGENIIDLFIRIAGEVGKKPEETYILESFGPLSKTKLYKQFERKYGKYFMSQQVPVAMNLCDTKNKKQLTPNVAILTGNHDLPPMKEYVDNLLEEKRPTFNKRIRNKFKLFCETELKLTPEEMKSKKTIFENIMKWHYIQNVKQVQTTLQDALGIYFRPNIPGFWNGIYDKFLMKTSPEALLNYWGSVFPKDFLSRDNKHGINPGYKEAADDFVKLMNELYK